MCYPKNFANTFHSNFLIIIKCMLPLSDGVGIFCLAKGLSSTWVVYLSGLIFQKIGLKSQKECDASMKMENWLKFGH